MIETLRHSLKTRVALATLAIFVLSLWALGYFSARMLLTDIERMVGEQQFSTASLVASHIEEEIQTRMTSLERVAERIDRNILDRHELLQADLEDRQVLRLLFNGGFFVTDAAGTATASVPLSAERAGINFMFRDHVAGAIKDGKATISEIVIGKQLQVPVVSLAVPIRDAHERIIGSLVGVINLSADNFLDKITANPYGRTGGYLIVSPQQRLIITSTDKSRIMETLPPPSTNSLLDRFIRGYEGSAVFVNPKGEEVLASAKGIPVAGWYAASIVPTAEAFAPVRDMQQRMLFATLLLTLLAGGLTWWWLRRQLAPIEIAANALSARSGTGMLSEPLPRTTQDEIGQLIGGFNQLLATLQANEGRLATIAAITSDLVYSCFRGNDGIFRVDWMSGNAEPVFGVTTSDLIARGCWRPFVIEQDLPLFARAITDLQPGQSGEQVMRIAHRDGSIRWLQSMARVDNDPANAARHRLVGALRDITERVQVEQERARLASILEVTSDIVSMADPQGHIIYLNGPGRVLLGIEPEGALPEVIAKVHPQWATDIILGEGLPTAIRAGTWSGETAVLGPGGQEIPVSQVILCHKDNDGNLLFLSTIMRDIRESRAAALALRDSEERLRLALTAASQGLYDLDLVTGDAKVSPEYATMLGYDPVIFRETNAAWRERLHPDDQATVYKAYEDYVAGRLSEYRVEFRQRTRDGSWKWVLSLGRIQAWSPDGRPLRMLGTHTDIDAIKAAEASLRDLNATLEARVAQRTAELTAANEELESFAYAVSHDLRAPLRAMSGFSVALKEDFGASLTGDAKRYLDQIDLASRRMSDLIDGLLTLSRSTRGELRHDPVNLSVLALRRLERLAHSESQRLVTTDVEPGLHALGDARMIEVVIGNLIDNAWKYTGRTAAPHIRVHAGLVNGVRGFCVSDNGAGFDMAHAARLFKPFQRLHRQEEFPGTGIGLATVQRIVHRHGGEIVAQGKPGEGASFCFTLPASGLEKP